MSSNINELIIDNPKTRNRKLTWVNINNAGKAEIKYLRQKYNFNLEHLYASSSNVYAQRTVFERTPEYIFLIVHFPVMNNGRIEAAEAEFFFGNDYLITVHNNISKIDLFFNSCKKDPKTTLSYTEESPRLLLYEIFEKTTQHSFKILDQMTEAINAIEKNIFSRKHKSAVENILQIRHNIISFRRIVQNHATIVQDIMNLKSDKLITPRDLRKYYSNLSSLSRNIWNTLENRKEVVEILNSTNESLMNYRLNRIMQTLTIFSVIVFPLTLLAALFGMNVVGGMPLIDHPQGFWILISIMSFGGFLMFLYFKFKKWI